MDFLQEEGYRPSQDEDGDIVFKHEAVTYLLFVEEEDTNYFRLVYPAFWEISTPDEEEKAAIESKAERFSFGKEKIEEEMNKIESKRR